MAYSKVERQTWNDERFRRWGRNTRDAWLYLMSSPHMGEVGGRLGCYVLDPMYAAADLSSPDHRWTPDQVEAELRRFEAADRIVWDPDARLVLLVNYFRHNAPENPNQAKGAASAVENLPFSETVLERLLTAIGEHLPAAFSSGKPCGSVIADAVRARIGNANGHNSGNGSGTVPRTVEETVVERYTQPEPEPEPEQEPEPEPTDDQPSSLPPDRAEKHPGEEEAPPASEPPDDGDGGQAEATEAMEAVANDSARRLPKGRERKRFAAAVRLLVTGEDYTAWQDNRGDKVPWPDRPWLLKLAIAAWEAGERDKLRYALQLVIVQQYDPLRMPASGRPPPGSEAAAASDETPGAGRGGSGELARFGDGRSAEEHRREEEAEDERRIEAFGAEHPDRALELRQQARAEIDADERLAGLPDRTLDRFEESKYRMLVRRKLEDDRKMALAP